MCRASQITLQKLSQQDYYLLTLLFISKLKKLSRLILRSLPHIWVILTQNVITFYINILHPFINVSWCFQVSRKLNETLVP